MDEQIEEKDPFEAVPNFADRLVVAKFTEDQKAGFTKVFSKIDKTSSGSLGISEIGNMLRAVGMNPSNKLINDILAWFQEKNIERFTIDNFMKILEQIYEKIEPDELRDALRLFDKEGNGYFTLNELKKILFTYGEKLDEDEFKDFTKAITIQSDGTINHEGLIKFSDFFKIISQTN